MQAGVAASLLALVEFRLFKLGRITGDADEKLFLLRSARSNRNGYSLFTFSPHELLASVFGVDGFLPEVADEVKGNAE